VRGWGGGDCDCSNGIRTWDNPSRNGMTTKLTLDKAGRVVLPKPLRDELELAAGDTLELESRGEQITLRPVRGAASLQKERGIWVYRTGRTLTAATTDQTLRQICEERDGENKRAR
jgi:AbrB family looped-hinge helix DNA binding protein